MTAPDFLDNPPGGDELTDYDRAHVTLFMRLLDATDVGADWREIVRVLFDIDPEVEPDRARAVHDRHLTRARWMTDQGYRQLARPAAPV